MCQFFSLCYYYYPSLACGVPKLRGNLEAGGVKAEGGGAVQCISSVWENREPWEEPARTGTGAAGETVPLETHFKKHFFPKL